MLVIHEIFKEFGLELEKGGVWGPMATAGNVLIAWFGRCARR